MAEGGVPRGAVKEPPMEGSLAVSSRHCTEHVAHGKDPIGVGMDCPGTNYKRYHQNMGHRPARDPVEGGGGTDRHPSTSKHPYVRCLTQVRVRNRDEDGYNGVESRSRCRQHISTPPLPGLPGPKEGLWHRGLRTSPHNTGWI